MSREVRMDSKRMQVARLLEEAGEGMVQAGKKLVGAARALQLIEEAERKVQRALKLAVPTTFSADEMDSDKPKTLRDGLPAHVRQKIQRRGESLKALAQEVGGLAVTKQQRALKEERRRRAAATGGG